MTKKSAEEILEGASNLLKNNESFPCDVEFKLKGPVKTFNNTPAVINNAHDLNEVHRVPADIKIVQAIHFCAGHKGRFLGCAWRPKRRPRTVIVAPPNAGGRDPVLWAHEFGHTTGLLHRNDKYNFLVLMSPCEIASSNQNINKKECRHFRAGPVKHYPPGLGPTCPKLPFEGFQTD